MGMIDKVRAMLATATAAGVPPIPLTFQGISKVRVRDALGLLERATDDMVDAVFALLDDRASWFSAAPSGLRFCDGATTAHIGCHVGILQRGKDKLDREGRDYWIKPLRAIGAIEAVYFDRNSRTFLPGHPTPKSPNSAYRLDGDFVRVLQLPDGSWDVQLKHWIHGDTSRLRLAFQAVQADQTRARVASEHRALIDACCAAYAPRFLAGYEILFVDDSDGTRISEAASDRLAQAGLAIGLGDAMPDVLLWNRHSDALWVIEAVTSDGEVDEHKRTRVAALAEKHGKRQIGFTTAYPTWRIAAQRQSAHKNIAIGTYIWIRDDASKHFRVESFPV